MKGIQLGMALCLVLCAAPAFAVGESPRYVSLEFSLGNFFPLIDSESGLAPGARPYAETFGEGAGMLRFEFNVEKFVYQGWGSALVGIGAGYAEKFGVALTEQGSVSQEKTGLRFYPLRILADYRFDYAALHWNVPLVPYVRASFICMPWQAVVGDHVESADGFNGSGVRFGYGLTGGLAFMLDVLQPRMIRDLDAEFGINHVYLLAEFNFEQVNGFTPGLNLSSRRFMFGLAFDL